MGAVFVCEICNQAVIPNILHDCPGKDIRNQAHYASHKIQPATFIAANGLDFFEGNAIKYICRYKKKNGVEDLEKAKHYIDMLIQRETTGEVTFK